MPGPRGNALVGPGDVGKSTVLDAISMVLSPAPGWIASEHDYYRGNTSETFVIELLVGALSNDLLSSWPVAPVWGWDEATRKARADLDPNMESVLCLRAIGSPDLEIGHVVIDPSGSELALSPSTRRKFGLSRLGAPATAYRELRMSRGSLLSLSLNDDQLRRLVTEAVQTARASFSPSQDISERLEVLSQALEQVAPGAGALALAMLPP